MRPAHLHFLVYKPGFKTLISQIYDPEDTHLETDVQFGVTRHLIGNYVRHDEPCAGAPDVKAPWYSLEHTFVMENGDGAPAAAADHRQGARRTAANSASRTEMRRRRRPPVASAKQTYGRNIMMRRTVLKGIAATAAGGIARPAAIAADTVLKIGCSLPMTGAGFTAVGRQLKAAIKVYMQQHGDTVAGRKIELIIRDDGGVADNARRIIQEMIVNDKVDIVGIGITPLRWRSRRSSPKPRRRPGA